MVHQLFSLKDLLNLHGDVRGKERIKKSSRGRVLSLK